MRLKLMYITNDSAIATIAENAGVDWIFLDLEIIGKKARQGHLDTVISNHCISDIRKLKNVISKSKLLVRVNPIYDGSEDEINQVIHNGADIIMLPYFASPKEVKLFIEIVDNRAKICLLVETPKAVENLDDILNIEGIDYIHIGLNDLHLGYKMKFMFEPLSNGQVEEICNKIKNAKIEYGFGGIANLGQGKLPAELIISEHYRLNSTMVILSRSFCNISKIKKLSEIEKQFFVGVKEIREYEKSMIDKNKQFYIDNKNKVKEKILAIIKELN